MTNNNISYFVYMCGMLVDIFPTYEDAEKEVSRLFTKYADRSEKTLQSIYIAESKPY